MAFLQGKTPISFLQELCTKHGITPQYDLIANEGAVHEPIFVFKVTAGEFMGTGKGPSKKKAKHNAALSVLNLMMGQAPAAEDYSKITQQGSQDALVGNPVGQLQEMTQKRLWPPPIYEFTSEQGPPHSREFICTVKLFNLHEQGKAKSKKLSKRNAAYAMIQLIKQGLATPQPEVEHPEEADDEEIPLPQGDIKAAYTTFKEGKKMIPTLTPAASQTIKQFYQSMKDYSGKTMNILQETTLSVPSNNYCQMLQEIAEAQRFEVTYIDIDEPSHSGLRQCFTQLSFKKKIVSHGMGKTLEDAHNMAAQNGLQALLTLKVKKQNK